jgi:hypothetical protein
VLAAAAPGKLAATAAEMVRMRRRFDPDPARAEELTDGYGRLVEALEDRGWLEPRFNKATFRAMQDSNVAFLNSETAGGTAS